MNKVKTFEEARKLSLIKWNKVKYLSIELDNLIDTDCSFCEYSNFLFDIVEKRKANKLIIPSKIGSCEHCPVEKLCDKLIKEKDNHHVFMNFVYELIDKLEDMKEENYKSRHQLKGGE